MSHTTSGRGRNPIVNVCLENNPQTVYSISVPPSKNWEDFFGKVRSQFNLKPNTDLLLFEEDATTKELIQFNISAHDDMEYIDHGTRFTVVVYTNLEGVDEGRQGLGASGEDDIIMGSSSSSDNESDKNDADNNSDGTMVMDFDLFGRFDDTRKKSKPLSNTVIKQQKYYKTKFHAFRHQVFKVTHLNENYSKLVLDNHQLTVRRAIWPANVVNKTTEFQYGMENILSWKWCVILCHGGRFSIGIFEGNNPIHHRTFATYVARSKQGRRQMNHLTKGGKSNSAGGQIRETNEIKLRKKIHATLTEWLTDINACSHLWVHGPGPVNDFCLYGTSKDQDFLYGKEDEIEAKMSWCIHNPAKAGFRLRRDDPRIHKIPITTHRAKFEEVTRVHRYLAAAMYTELAAPQDEYAQDTPPPAEVVDKFRVSPVVEVPGQGASATE